MTRMLGGRPGGAGCACAGAVWNGAAGPMADAAARVVPAKRTFRRFNLRSIGLTFFFRTASTPVVLALIPCSFTQQGSILTTCSPLSQHIGSQHDSCQR